MVYLYHAQGGFGRKVVSTGGPLGGLLDLVTPLVLAVSQVTNYVYVHRYLRGAVGYATIVVIVGSGRGGPAFPILSL